MRDNGKQRVLGCKDHHPERRPSYNSSMVAQTRHGGQSPKQKLTFHGQLAGKGVTTDALLKKLKTLHDQLAVLDQEKVDVNSLSTARTELIHVSLLLHKDRGVKAYAACCLADILRLYAPEAPYTQHELRDIFQFFFRQLSAGLKGTEEPYYNEYFHLLESLSTVKSVVLVCDLPSSDELLHEIFKDLFTIVKRDFTKKIEIFMADILAALIDECTSLPNDVLEVIMAQFMEKNAVCNQALIYLYLCVHPPLVLTSFSSYSELNSQVIASPFRFAMLRLTSSNVTFVSTSATFSPQQRKEMKILKIFEQVMSS